MFHADAPSLSRNKDTQESHDFLDSSNQPFLDVGDPDDSDDEGTEEDDELVPLPEVPAPPDNEWEDNDASAPTKAKARGRPKGSKNKIHVPNPLFQRHTRSRKHASVATGGLMSSMAFFTAYMSAADTHTSIYDDPIDLADAIKRPDWPDWEKAVIREFKGVNKKKTWVHVPRSSVPRGEKVLGGKLVFKTKRDAEGNISKYKVRWVVKGCQQKQGRDYNETFASVCKSVSWKIVIALAAVFDLHIEQMDAVLAFLNAKADADIYVQIPPGYEELAENLPPDTVCKLLRALYRLKQAPRLWQNDLSEALQEMGFKLCVCDPSIYVHAEYMIIIVTYVDDMLMVGKDLSKIRLIQKQLSERFEMETLGPTRHFLGVKITRDRQKKTILLSQEAYIDKILDRFGMTNCKAVATPMAAGALEFMVPNTQQAT